jgi:dipeptidase E
MEPAAYPECEEWITDLFEAHGLTDVRTWTDLEAVDRERMDDVSAVFLGGGNTYRLRHLLRRSGVDESLVEFVEAGGDLYGGSAGAIVCGETIETTPDENRVGLEETVGLGLLPGVDVWCHYDGEDAAGEYARRSGRPVIAVPERSGVVATTQEYEVVGHEPTTVFEAGTATAYDPAQTFQL